VSFRFPKQTIRKWYGRKFENTQANTRKVENLTTVDIHVYLIMYIYEIPKIPDQVCCHRQLIYVTYNNTISIDMITETTLSGVDIMIILSICIFNGEVKTSMKCV
jgi:hypothetical protein